MNKAERKELYMSLTQQQRRSYMDNYMRRVFRKVLSLAAGGAVLMVLTIIVFVLVVESPTQRQTYGLIFGSAGIVSVCFLTVLLLMCRRFVDEELRRVQNLPGDGEIPHEETPTATPPSYAIQWRDYRRRRTLFWVGATACLPVVLASQRWHLAFGRSICMIAFIMLFVTRWRLDHWRCPRCAQQFFRTKWFAAGFTKECLHCGLPKWAEQHSQEGSPNNEMDLTN